MARKQFSYNIHGEVSVVSDVALPELKRFMTSARFDRPTIRVSIPRKGTPWALPASQRPVSANGRRIVYFDRLGRMGFGMEIMYGEPGDPIEVAASPLLAHSPHVLYTNVVEPILRWTFVERGFALVHGACVAINDLAYLITARTDTGKTTTILKLLDNYPEFAFLSDDLTLVRPDGRVLPYPKPLTISAHTMVAVKTPLLSRRERMTLPLQSRLHSKSGRLFGMLLAKTRLPMATMNAIVQLLVPPPKYHVERLVPHVRQVNSPVPLGGMFVIERGEGGVVRLSQAEALEILMQNCDDAYGFPPYSDIKEGLFTTGERDLRPSEQQVVANALASVPAMLVRSATRDWWAEISQLVNAGQLIRYPSIASPDSVEMESEAADIVEIPTVLAGRPAPMSAD